jgi:hypothetical protein
MNERHTLDVISLVFGLLFMALALPVLLTDTPLSIDARWLWPAAVIALGAIVAGSGLRRREERIPSPGEQQPNEDI